MINRLPVCLAAVLAALSITVTAQNWLQFTTIKTWTGTVSVDAVDASDPGGAQKTAIAYAATGNLTLTDNLSSDPEAVHSSWPFPSPAETADPARAANAFKRWPAHVVYTRKTTGIDELGQKVDYQCRGESTIPALVQLTISPMSPNYLLRIEPPAVAAKCTGTSTLDESYKPTQELKVELPIPSAKGPLAGTRTLTLGTLKATVTFNLTPA